MRHLALVLAISVWTRMNQRLRCEVVVEEVLKKRVCLRTTCVLCCVVYVKGVEVEEMVYLTAGVEVCYREGVRKWMVVGGEICREKVVCYPKSSTSFILLDWLASHCSFLRWLSS